jgi:hypothetical protein
MHLGERPFSPERTWCLGTSVKKIRPSRLSTQLIILNNFKNRNILCYGYKHKKIPLNKIPRKGKIFPCA